MVEDREISIHPAGIDEFVSERPAGLENFQAKNTITTLAIPDERITRDPITVALDDQAQYDQIVGELHQINTSRQILVETPVPDSQTPEPQSVKKGISLGTIATAGFIAIEAIVELERGYTRFKQSFGRKKIPGNY